MNRDIAGVLCIAVYSPNEQVWGDGGKQDDEEETLAFLAIYGFLFSF